MEDHNRFVSYEANGGRLIGCAAPKIQGMRVQPSMARNSDSREISGIAALAHLSKIPPEYENLVPQLFANAVALEDNDRSLRHLRGLIDQVRAQRGLPPLG